MKHMIGVVVSGVLIAVTASAQTTSPRNLQAPTEAELLAACQKDAASERAACEKRVREGGIPSAGSRNKSAAQQQAERAKTQENRAVEDPGVSTTPPRTANEAPTTTRSSEDRTRLSQQSDQAKNAHAPQREAGPNTSTTAAPTRLGNGQREASGDQATRDRKARDDRASRDAPTQDRARSRPNDNPKQPTP